MAVCRARKSTIGVSKCANTIIQTRSGRALSIVPAAATGMVWEFVCDTRFFVAATTIDDGVLADTHDPGR
jgi:hypothetical protein